MFKLAHGLRKRATLLAYKIGLRYTHVGVENFAEVAISSHVLNRANINARCIHGNNDFANARVWRAIVAGSTDEIAIVSNLAEARPDFLSVNDPFVAVIGGKCFE